MTPPNKPTVLFVNRSYWPDTEATGQLLTELCHDLADDFDITVLAGQPNHTQAGIDYQRTGEFFHEGVRIVRIKHTQFAKSSMIGKSINLISFTLSAFWRTLTFPRTDIVVTESDPFFLPILGRWLKWRRGSKFVAYLQDLYPDVAIAVGKIKEGFVSRILRRWLFGAYRQSDQVVVLSQDMKQTCLDHGVPAEKLTIIPNWADVDKITPIKQHNEFRQQHGLTDQFVVMYSGNMGLAHDLMPIVEAASLLDDRTDIVFVVIGEGVQKPALQQRAAELGLTNIRFLPYQPREFLAQSLSAGDLHLVSVKSDAVRCLMPSKLYGILASGSAVLAICPLGSELADIVTQQEVGFVCDSDNLEDAPERIAFVTSFLANNPEQARQMETNARQLATTAYHRTTQTRRFGKLLRRLVGLADPIDDTNLTLKESITTEPVPAGANE